MGENGGEDGAGAAGGLKLQNTEKLRDFLKNVAGSTKASEDCRKNMLKYTQETAVPYEVIREAYSIASGEVTPIDELLAGSTFALEKPKPREKSEELKARLQKLQEALDQKAYDALVQDVTKSSDYEPEVFSSFKEQLGLGLHVLVTMFTGFAFAYSIFRSQFPDNPAVHAAGGALGLIVGMLLETVLFIVRDAQKTKHEERRAKKAAQKIRGPTNTEIASPIASSPTTTSIGRSSDLVKRNTRKNSRISS
ncbi:hypothetical protein R1flu_025016 [Riccia fluitans]|uniref:Endoplasmic reticulum-based factor for assembly of V-ATPase n=1 Tax=Riccia fluitans TaxID=41844 RepID=A0ABD1XWJ5_9MARC